MKGCQRTDTMSYIIYFEYIVEERILMRNLQFPELPRQWSSHGYEIDELLGQGSYGAVYRMVRNKGTDQEEYWALKVIEKNLTKKRTDSNIVMT